VVSIRKIPKVLWDETWLEKQRIHVMENFQKTGSNQQMEALISPIDSSLNISQMELLEIADHSQIQTFGWPIAIVFRDIPILKPVSKVDGIVSEVKGNVSGLTYGFSYFKKNGQIFISKSLYEDRNYPKFIIPDVRIKRMTELIMFVSRFYSRCNLSGNEKIKITVKYSGLLNSSINFVNGGILRTNQMISKENESISEIITSISEIETKLPELVGNLLDGLFVLFDFYNPTAEYIKSIVDEFVIDTNRASRTIK
jgi:hypothetical protein